MAAAAVIPRGQPAAAAPCAGGGVEQVAVVVAFPSGVVTGCAAPGGTGIDVLAAAGFAPAVHQFGSVGTAAVCALTHPVTQEQVGCAPGPSCLRCDGRDDYWASFPGYRYAQVGAGTRVPAAGSVEAWRFGTQVTWSGARPRATEVCPPTVCPAPPPPTVTAGGVGPTRPDPDPGGGPSPTPSSPPGTAGPPAPGSTVPSGGGPDQPPPGSSAPAPAPTTGSPAEEPSGGPDRSEPAPDPVGPPGDRDAGAGGRAPAGDDTGSGDESAVAPGGGPGPDGPGGGGVAAALATTAGLVTAVGAAAVWARRRRLAHEGGQDA